MDMANSFLNIKKEAAPKIALATALCIISPITLLLLLGSLECGILTVSENTVVGIGLIALLGIIAIACAIFISCGMKSKEFEFLEKEIIETEYGVTGMVKERKRKYEETYARYNIYGTVLCIMGAMTLFTAIIFEEYAFMGIFLSCLLLVFVAVGVRLFIIAGIRQASFEKLLQEGDYTVKKKAQAKNPVVAAVSTIYWLIVTAIFLVLSFSSRHWNTCGLIWPIAGVLFPAVLAVVKLFEKKE